MSTHGQAAIEEICSTAGIGIDQHRPWDLRVHNVEFYDPALAVGSLGLARPTYLAGGTQMTCSAFFERQLSTGCASDRKSVGWFTALAFLKAHLVNVQTTPQARRLADTDYNLGNELFEQMLGPSMAYSCAYWNDASDLDAAQFAKHDLICRELKLRPGVRVLDISCGKGSFARYAARNYDVEFEYARTLCTGLPVPIDCCDYQEFEHGDQCEPFYKVASFGTIEHVGYQNYRKMFKGASAGDRLRPSSVP